MQREIFVLVSYGLFYYPTDYLLFIYLQVKILNLLLNNQIKLVCLKLNATSS